MSWKGLEKIYEGKKKKVKEENNMGYLKFNLVVLIRKPLNKAHDVKCTTTLLKDTSNMKWYIVLFLSLA